jgi:hypothetical protein
LGKKNKPGGKNSGCCHRAQLGGSRLPYPGLQGPCLNSRSFPKTSVFGKATLDLLEKAGFRPLFRKPFPKLTEFWERLSLDHN